MQKQILRDLGVPLLILFTLTLLFWLTDLDNGIESLFFSPERGWYLKDDFPWTFLYQYGTIPALSLFGLAVAVLVVGFFCRRMSPHRRAALFMIALMILGPGLVVNVVLKGQWGRPRPRQVEDFGGSEKYLPVWFKGPSGNGKSFPSGHASMGFYLFSPFFLLRKKHSHWARLSLFVGLGYGILMGVGRMAQGGHFPSDVVWSGGLVYVCGVLLYHVFYSKTAPVG